MNNMSRKSGLSAAVKKRQKNRRQNLDEVRLRFKIRLADPSAASNVGLFVASRYEVDTELGTLLQELGDRFEYWKLNSLAVHAIPFLGSTTVGFHGLGLLSDPQDTTPASASAFMNMKQIEVKPIFNPEPCVLKVFPKGPLKWRYCKDIVLEDDRFEAFGDIVYGTFSTALSQVHAILHATVDVSFKYPAITAINAPRPVGKRNLGDDEEVEYIESTRIPPVLHDVKLREAQNSIPIPSSRDSRTAPVRK